MMMKDQVSPNPSNKSVGLNWQVNGQDVHGKLVINHNVILLDKTDEKYRRAIMNQFISFLLFRVLLPIILISAFIVRFNGISFIYLLLFLICPLLRTPSNSSLAGHTGRYLKALVSICVLLSVGHVAFQIFLLSTPPYGHNLSSCNDLETILRHVGFVRYNNLDYLNVARYVVPEILMLIISVILVVVFRKKSDVEIITEPPQLSPETPVASVLRSKPKKTAISAAINVFLDLLLLAATSIARPSITNSIYLLFFLAIATWVACYKNLGKKFMRFRIFILFFAALHIIALYLYQFQIMQDLIPPYNLYVRLFGLTKLIATDCEDGDPRVLQFTDLEWASFANPGILCLLYWVLAIQTRVFLSSKVQVIQKNLSTRDGMNNTITTRFPETQPFVGHAPPTSSQHHYHHHQQSGRRKSTMLKLTVKRQSTEKSPLLDPENAAQTYQTVAAGDDEHLEIDPNGSVIWSSHPSEAPVEVEAAPPEDRLKTVKKWLSPIISIVQLITRQSYIATLIIMMAWSITYHSWLTFVLLLWSCILWMMPNSRKACWQSSPFLVAYAEALIIIQYVYSLDLNNDELPQQIDTVNLSQIGLQKVTDLACIPLSIKILYTVMFWITLRQYMQEKFKEKNKDIAEGVMMRPVNMAYATSQPGAQAQSDLQRQQSVTTGSKLMKKLGKFILDLLTKYFIWLVALMLMLNALGGTQVVVFRIIYMALFLFFVLMFQLSYKIWRSIMYGFWLTVIIYSMILLILIYTYQFENFPDYWETYLKISKDLQRDIGLEAYDTGGLFLNLLRATFFVVITIIQLHYFHKDFLRISDIDKVDENTTDTIITVPIVPEPVEPQQEIVQSEPAEQPVTTEKASETQEVDPASIKPKEKGSAKEMLKSLSKKVSKKVMYAYDLISDFCWRYLEIHIIKIVLFSVLLLALYDVCAIHFIFVLFVIIGTPVRKLQGCISHCCALWASILLISKMIYQIDYIHEHWVVNCTDFSSEGNRTVNNANWMGFEKVSDLPKYLQGYLGLMFVLTIQAVVKVRMRHHRVVTNQPEPKLGIMYPDVTRQNADEGLLECAKYLINFGFYKFGVEICLMTITAGVGVRLDVFAVIYALILAVMFLLRRKTLAKIWPFYVSFLAFIIPIQYLMCVGIPPGLCLEYIYTIPMHSELREWLFLPDYDKPPEAYKLTVDFFLLLFACCQLTVFSIETSANAEEYEGGSNKEIIYQPDYIKFNPIADYVTNTRSYLDLVKVGVFFSLYWVTLAIFFLAGTNRVSLFAMGYVIGCFLFLWNGQEFFLKPIQYILKWWNVLISYTVIVIFIKSVLQLVGCVFLDDLYANFCWLIQLLGIACLKKFERNVEQPIRPASIEESCQVPVDEAGLLWDGICLAFLLLQKRFFCSYYFPHLVTEMRAQAALANRGAELINQMLMKEVLEQQAAEKEIVEKIKKKMDKIRMHQQKIRGSEYIEPENHYVDYSASSTPMYSMSLSPHPGVEYGRMGSGPPFVGTTSSPQVPTSPTPAIPTPSSAAYTFSLEGYMEPKLSTGTPRIPSRSQLPLGSPSEDSFPVFSPPPYPALQGVSYTPRSSLVGPSHAISHRSFVHRPSISVSSPAPSHHTSIRSGDYYLFEDFSDDEGLAELEYGDSKKAKEKEDTEEEVPVKGIPVSKLLASAMKTDIKHAVTAAQKAKGVESDSEPVSGPSDQSGRTPVSRTVSGGSQVSFALSHRDSLSPHDIPTRRPQTLPTLHTQGEGQSRTRAEQESLEHPPLSGSKGGEPPDSSTSPGGDYGEEVKDESSEETIAQKVQNILKFIWAFIEGLMVSGTAKLNIISRDYRYVARCLRKEKKALKEKWQMDGKEQPIESALSPEVVTSEKLIPITDETLQIRVEKASEDRTEDSVRVEDSPDNMQKEFEADQPPVVRLLIAIWYAIVSRSEIVCYIMIVVNQIKSASILSLPLPLMAFLWGTLSIPRPSKSFWITVITYTEAIVVIKYMFQFGFFPWNQLSSPQPFWAPRILGIEKKDQYAVYDLALLLVVFFHRFILKSLGLWKDTSKSDIGSVDASEVKESAQQELSASSDERKSSFSVSQKEETIIVDRTGGGTILLGFLQYIQPIRSFIQNLLNPPYRVTRDVYAFMFVCDFITFLIVVFGYWAFGTGGGDGVASYFEENKVPVPFLIMLIAQFGLIVVDRALFLRKYILGKLIFQIVIVFVVHLWMFFILPAVTERQFNSNVPPQLWYFVKCMYLLLSAYQIRSGYPTRILGNFLTKKYNYLNLILFKGFMAIPFLFELRALMDWIWTDTSMAVGSWLKMEDIFAHIFVTKCTRRAEAEYPVARGQNRKAVVKYGVGGILLFVIILIIWFPLVLFALGNTVGLPNPPIGCTIEISFSGFEPIFKMSAQYSDLKQFTEIQYETLSFHLRTNPGAQTFLTNYNYQDLYVAQLSGSSTSFWTISPPSVEKLGRDLNADNDITLRFSWQFSHVTSGKDTDPIVGDNYIKILPKDDPVRTQLASMIKNMSKVGPLTPPVTVTNLMPKFIRVPPKGKATAIKQLIPDKNYYSNLTLSLEKGMYQSTNDSKFWWVIHEDCENNPYKWLPYTNGGCNEDNVTIVSFNDKVFPSTLSILSGYGIIGLYTTIVLVASRFVRGIVAGVSFTIMFDDMPCVDRVLQLCLDIYLVRESGELKLEEDLFAKLIFLYRSPETLIKWTRYPQAREQPQ